MWAPSLWSVLIDLWRFFWRLDTSSDSPITATSPTVVAEPLQSARPITLDTQTHAKIQLDVGTLYMDVSIETILIRTKLKEYHEQLVQSGNLNLIEWLLYNIHLQNSSIALLALKMSPLGLWHQTVKGLPNVRVGIEPTTGALMEWFDEAKVGHVGLIERVTPDSTVTLRSISSIPSGTYVEQMFTESAWKELGPVFTRFRP